MEIIGGLFGTLALAAAFVYWRRLRREVGSGTLTDEQLRRIEEEGALELDEPLDHEEISEAEERFWAESWDEPEEWS